MGKKKTIRVTCRVELYFNIDVSDNPSNQEIRERAETAYGDLPILSADALEHFGDVVELISIEDEETSATL